jgi:alpha-glucosidase
MNFNNFFFVLTIVLISPLSVFSQHYSISSPDGKIHLKVNVKDDINFAVSLNEATVISPTPLSIETDAVILGRNPRVKSKKEQEVRNQINPIVPLKSAIVEDRYNELLITFRGNYALAFRAYNDGVAYRFQTMFKDDLKINKENLKVNFTSDCDVYFPEEQNFISHYERSYIDTTLASISDKRFCSLPVLVKTKEGTNILITEANLSDYPNMFMYGTGENALTAAFPPVVLKTSPIAKRADREERITKEAEYIAQTSGTRNFPWRVFAITQTDGELIANNLVFKLSNSSALSDTEWIKPGKVAWDWYNANNIYGVDFKAGLNTATYKYYIDFAASHDIEYIILDEGWSKSTTDLTAPNADINLQELISYGKKKNVGIILWMLWKPLQENMEELLTQFSEWGAKGIKVDFMQRADQDVVNYYERVAREAAEQQLLVDFHGSYKPTGLHRTYPNVMTFEGLKGLENNKWSRAITPEHNLTLPFIRMVAGPMDYTPGSMINANNESFRDIFDSPMSMGTRCHQLAMYVVYESPLQMLADTPTNYYREPESAAFISRIPVTWDETKVLDAKVADYILMARKKGETWYVGAMTDWTPREFTLDFSFLDEGEYNIEIMQDGINADRNANDYKKNQAKITKESKLPIKLAPGGGWAAIIERIDK